jgi:AbrB family looped-hinge helix DNA binding protein
MALVPVAGLVQLQKFCNTVGMGIPVTITSRGVITLPARLRRELGLRADDQLIAEVTPAGLLLRPAVTLPLEIYTAEREREFDESEADLASVLKPRPRPRKSAGVSRKRGPGRSR